MTSGAKVGTFVVAALAFGQVLVSLDASVVTVALPAIQAELGTTSGQMQLIVVGYMIALAGLILPISAFSDRIGRKPVYLFGALLFIAGSALCGGAWDTWILIAARGIQGIGAACLMGLALAILTDSVDRSKVPGVVAMWTTVTIAANAAGPAVGGVIVTGLGWRSVFFINVPLALLVLLVAAKALPNDRKHLKGKAGFGAGILLAATLAMMTLGLTAAERAAWLSTAVVVPLIVAVLLLGVFVLQQRRTTNPMIQWGMLKTSTLPVALGLLLILSLALAGALYQMSLFTQNVLGYTAATAGIVTLSASVSMALITPFSGKIQRVVGAALPFVIGMVIAAVGLQMLGRLAPDSSTWLVVVGLFVMGVGLAIAIPIVQSVAMQQSTPKTAGAVSGSLGLASQIAGILGITVIGSLTTRRALDLWAAGGGKSSLDPLVGVGDVSQITSKAGDAAGQLAAVSYSSGVDLAFTVAAALALIAGIIGLFALPKRRVKASADDAAQEPKAQSS